jgi:hypothetical protein
VWRPVDLAQPDHAASRGQLSTEPARASSGSAPGMPRGSPWGGRRDATPRLPGPAAAVVVAGIPEICPPGEGIYWLGAGAIREPSTAVQRRGLSHPRSWQAFPCMVSEFLKLTAPWFPVSPRGDGHGRGTNQDCREREVCRPAAGQHEGDSSTVSRRELASGRSWSATT